MKSRFVLHSRNPRVLKVSDVVVDTNVLEHTLNRAEERQEHAARFLESLADSEVAICFDTGLHPVEAHNTSRIYAEYLDRLRGSPPLRIVGHKLRSRQFQVLSDNASDTLSDAMRGTVNNSTDRVFVSVAENSETGVLVSHDYNDFPNEFRDQVEDCCEVTVVEAKDVRFGN